MRMWNALAAYYGGKRKLVSIIFNRISKVIPREKWYGMAFIDAFLGGGAVSLYAKSQGFKVTCNDIAKRSYIAGKALIKNSTKIKDEDIQKLFLLNEHNSHFIEENYVPDVFAKRHAVFLDQAFANADTELLTYLLIKYIFHIRPYSKFSSPNAFNRPFEDGRFDEIKSTYLQSIKVNLTSPLRILNAEAENINNGIFSNGLQHKVCNMDVFKFLEDCTAEGILYLDPPYAGTLTYESEYAVLDKILGAEYPESRFSGGIEALDELLSKAEKFPLWIISFGNAGGKNSLEELVKIVSKYRDCKSDEFEYRHCEAMASDKHKKECREWLITAWR